MGWTDKELELSKPETTQQAICPKPETTQQAICLSTPKVKMGMT